MTTSRLQTVRAALAAAAVVGTLAACGSSDTSTSAGTTPPAAESATTAPADPGTDPTGGSVEVPSEGAASSEAPSPDQTEEAAGEYADGTYDADGTYVSPNGRETVGVQLTLEGDVVTAVAITTHPSNPNTEQFQGLFAQGIADVVVGKNIDELSVDKVSGSSLTSGGFNEAVETIKSEARG